jgi:hypothetical protein
LFSVRFVFAFSLYFAPQSFIHKKGGVCNHTAVHRRPGNHHRYSSNSCRSINQQCKHGLLTGLCACKQSLPYIAAGVLLTGSCACKRNMLCITAGPSCRGDTTSAISDILISALGDDVPDL